MNEIKMKSGTVSRERKLESILKGMQGALVAFSGGTDSSYLLYMAVRLLGKEKLLAVTFSSAVHPREEIDDARAFAAALGVPHRTVEYDLLSREEFAVNSPERCYFCKTSLFERLAGISSELSLPVLLDGSNADDASDYRPGRRALDECGARSPLAEAGLSKLEIRALSHARGLATWDKPSAACLASRFPYGEMLTVRKIKQVEKAEKFLRGLGLDGDIRVRSHGGTARIEISPRMHKKLLDSAGAIVGRFRELGFQFVSLDLEGFRSGSMNRMLQR